MGELPTVKLYLRKPARALPGPSVCRLPALTSYGPHYLGHSSPLTGCSACTKFRFMPVLQRATRFGHGEQRARTLHCEWPGTAAKLFTPFVAQTGLPGRAQATRVEPGTSREHSRAAHDISVCDKPPQLSEMSVLTDKQASKKAKRHLTLMKFQPISYVILLSYLLLHRNWQVNCSENITCFT